MKKLIVLLALATTLFSHAQSKTKYQRHGKLPTSEINAIDTSDSTVIYTAYDSILKKERINAGLGWVDRFSGTVSGSVDYNDILNKPANIDEDSTNDVEKLATSPDPVLYWKGTKAQFYSEYGNPPTALDEDGIYVITDSIPATPNGGGDMLRNIYDTNNNGVVDNAAALGGVPAASYLTAEVDGSTTNELQTLSIAGQNLTLSNGGGTVAIPSGATVTTGTFTTSLVDAGGGATYSTTTTNGGRYTQVGNMVILSMRVADITRTGTATGELRLSGIPAGILPDGKNILSCSIFGAGTNFYTINAYTVSGQSYLQFELQTALDGSNSTLLGSINNGGYIYVNGVYFKS
jgi:hypothetical protein